MINRWDLWDYAGVLVGSFITALGLNVFLIPNKVAAGGVSGIATVLHYLFGVDVGMTMLVINIPLFLIATKALGTHFGLKTVIGTITLSLFTTATRTIQPMTHDIFLSTLYGGIVTGIGLGIVFRSRATTGGTDLMARLIHKYIPGFSVGQLLLTIDFIVVATAGILFASAELSLYAIIAIFLSAWVIDLVQEGISYAKAMFIISQKSETIAHNILYQLGRGVTVLEGWGSYTGQKRPVLLAVVSRAEVTRLKQLAYEADPKAFIIVTDVHEVLGEGFKALE